MGQRKNSISSMAFIYQCVLFISIFKNGFGLKCYVCDSSLNETCSDIGSNSNIKVQECDLRKQTNINSWLAELNNMILVEGSSLKMETPMLCQKVVGIKGNGPKTTYRLCQLDSNPSPCDGLNKKAKKKDDKIEIVSCDVCREDSCNAGIRTQITQRSTLCIGGLSIALSIVLTHKLL